MMMMMMMMMMPMMMVVAVGNEIATEPPSWRLWQF
jgi:hypothetical protein